MGAYRVTIYIQGMRYIHRSSLKTHGNLKSSTCLVDSRWTVKISFFGLQSLTGVAIADSSEEEKESKYSELLWTAPELLRLGNNAPSVGTAKGDVYSFAIILQEILFRNTPFFYGELSAEGKPGIILNAFTWFYNLLRI